MTKQKLIIPGAVLGTLLVGYFGLGLYASGQAEKRLEDWLYDNELDGQVRWESISSTPFGGTVTLKGVTLTGSGMFQTLDLDVDTVQLSELADERDLKSLSLQLSGIRLPGSAQGIAAPLYELLHETGRNELQPFDMSLQGRYDAKDHEANFSFSVNLPQLFAVQASTELNNARNLDRTFAELGTQVVGLAMSGSRALSRLGYLEQSMRELQGIELGETSFSLRDHGYFARNEALRQRYEYRLEPGKDSAEKQRRSMAEREQRSLLKGCSETWSATSRTAEKICENWLLALHGQSKGIELQAKPKDRVRLSDLLSSSDNPERAVRTLERLNLKVDKL